MEISSNWLLLNWISISGAFGAMLALILTGHPHIVAGWLIVELGLKAWQLPHMLDKVRELRRAGK
jgi:hypothetical protein